MNNPTLLPQASKADRRATALGCEDKRINNCSPEFRGVVVINGQAARVDRASSFSGVLHYAIFGKTHDDGEWFCGWVPAFLCEIPEADEAGRLTKHW